MTPEPVVAAPAPSAPAPKGNGTKDVFIDEDNTFGTAIQDALRRDFTINALFYDPMAGQVIDHTRGLRDLAKREIRTIGDPEVRLREDPVRILRAVRFACKLGLDFEPCTYAAMEGAVEDLPRCSAPRLLEETFRLIRGGGAAPSLKLLRALDALKLLLPPIDDHLRTTDAQGVEDFFSFAEALDEQIGEGHVFDDSQVLACILLPLALATPEPPPGSDGRLQVASGIERLLQELVRTSRLPRRIAERCRMILLAQKTLAGQRRRRGGLASFRRHPLFSEALKVFEVWVLATGERYHELELWKSGGAPEPTGDAQGPGRRRRRRRRGGGGGAAGQGGGGGPAPSAPA
jgi:poly(A) polymerase